MLIKILYLLFLNVSSVWLLSVAPVPERVWQQRCNGRSLALNDCNWCRCDKTNKYKCTARICDRVDMFGHFNDAITQFDAGMEGHGVWRSTEDQCTKGVHYRKGEILCVCTEDGNWPNSVCRDTFQVLHSVKPTKYNKPNNQSCSPFKLYQVGCNVCYCLPTGVMNPDLCTKRNCNDEYKESKKIVETADDNLPVQVYATCIRGKVYKIDCQTCMCLPNNRLLCDNCTDININDLSIKNLLQFKAKEDNTDSLCSDRVPGKPFQNKCNTCYCDNNGIIYCNVLKCLEFDHKISIPQLNYQQADPPIDDNECISLTKYKKDCNICHCFKIEGIKYFSCTLKTCHIDKQSQITNINCIEDTMYEKNCLICQCVTEKGTKREICTYNNRCKMVDRKSGKYPTSLATMHGYCEPLHVYYMDCNICKCLSNGQVMACTSKICPNTERSILVEFIPFIQKQALCPSSYSYKVDCNVCHCLSNGNILCTTKRCEFNEIKLLDNF